MGSVGEPGGRSVSGRGERLPAIGEAGGRSGMGERLGGTVGETGGGERLGTTGEREGRSGRGERGGRPSLEDSGSGPTSHLVAFLGPGEPGAVLAMDEAR